MRNRIFEKKKNVLNCFRIASALVLLQNFQYCYKQIIKNIFKTYLFFIKHVTFRTHLSKDIYVFIFYFCNKIKNFIVKPGVSNKYYHILEVA